MGNLSGTVALVTGASSGIGEATAYALAAEGCEVALVARRLDRLEEVQEHIVSEGGRALVVRADVTRQAEAVAAVENVVSRLGRLDIVINNAGVMLLGPIHDAPTEEWDRMIALNLQGALYVTHAALPHLLKSAEQDPRNVADIVNISSTAGRNAGPSSGVYSLTKFGLGALTESLRQEVAAQHVRVSLVEPGVVDTELTSHLRPEIRELSAARRKGVEILRAEDVADGVVYAVTRPRHVAISELMVRPSESAF